MWDEFKAAVFKVALAWVMGFVGMRLADWVLVATLIYTVLQIVVLLRKQFGKKEKDE